MILTRVLQPFLVITLCPLSTWKLCCNDHQLKCAIRLAHFCRNYPRRIRFARDILPIQRVDLTSSIIPRDARNPVVDVAMCRYRILVSHALVAAGASCLSLLLQIIICGICGICGYKRKERFMVGIVQARNLRNRIQRLIILHVRNKGGL